MRGMPIVVGLLAALGLVYAGQAQPQGTFGMPEVSYSADMVMRGGGQPGMPMTVHYTPEQQRVEMNPGGQQMVIVQKTDPPQAWMLFPAMRMYAEGPSMPSPLTWQRKIDDPDADVEITEVGPDEVNGIETTKYRIEGTDDMGHPYDGHVWSTDDRIMVKLDGRFTGPNGPQDMTIEVTRLDRGTPDAGLFQVPPPGYTKMPAGSMPAPNN